MEPERKEGYNQDKLLREYKADLVAEYKNRIGTLNRRIFKWKLVAVLSGCLLGAIAADRVIESRKDTEYRRPVVREEYYLSSAAGTGAILGCVFWGRYVRRKDRYMVKLQRKEKKFNALGDSLGIDTEL